MAQVVLANAESDAEYYLIVLVISSSMPIYWLSIGSLIIGCAPMIKASSASSRGARLSRGERRSDRA
jgi:hypothetical protein